MACFLYGSHAVGSKYLTEYKLSLLRSLRTMLIIIDGEREREREREGAE